MALVPITIACGNYDRTKAIIDGRVIRTRHAMISDGYRGARGTAKVEFGEHPRFARLRALRQRPGDDPYSTRLHLPLLDFGHALPRPYHGCTAGPGR